MPENSLAVLYCVRVEAATFNSGSDALENFKYPYESSGYTHNNLTSIS